jgi:hypothetical protein
MRTLASTPPDQLFNRLLVCHTRRQINDPWFKGMLVYYRAISTVSDGKKKKFLSEGRVIRNILNLVFWRNSDRSDTNMQ